MSDLEHIQNEIERGLARRVEQFKDSPNLEALLTALLQPFQSLEDSLWTLYTDRWVEAAEGTQLDNLGWIVGQAREGRTDAEYRPWIKARVFANRSNGTIDDALRIIALIEAGAIAEVHEVYPAAYEVSVLAMSADPNAVFQILSKAKPAGVRLSFEYSPEDPANLLILSDNTLTPASSAQGLGDATNPAIGGRLAGVFTL